MVLTNREVSIIMFAYLVITTCVLGISKEGGYMTTTAEILARAGVDAGRLCTLSELVEILHGRVGLPVSRATLYKPQIGDNPPPRFIFCNRSVYRLGDVVEWVLQRAVK